jgi:hypothetical protein
MPDTFDVFVSYAHSDVAAVVPIVQALRDCGLRVWFDKNAIETFAGITRSIETGVARSKLVMSYYSATYPTRPACQWELTAAFLTAQRAGNPADRVLVINPVESADHIEPVELRDALFARLHSGRDLRELAQKIGRRAVAVQGPLGELRALKPPRWFGNRSIGFTHFVGRLSELWSLHSALHRTDFPIITDRVGSTVVQVRGLGGLGKTLLVQEYARRFGPAFPGGVFWLRAQGEQRTEITAAEAESLYLQQIRAFGHQLGEDTSGMTADRIEGVIAKRLEDQGQPFLWIVDEVPPDLATEDLQCWFAPHPLGKTVFTTRSRQYEGLALSVDLGALDANDALRLLTLYHSPAGDDERQAAKAIAAELGGHPLALHVAACYLRSAPEKSMTEFLADLADLNEDELEFAAQLADTLPTGNAPSIAVTLKRSIRRLSTEARDYLYLAALLAQAPIPADLVSTAFRLLYQLGAKQAHRAAQGAQNECDRLSLSEMTDERIGARSVHSLVARTIRYDERDSQRTEVFKLIAVGAVGKALIEAGVGQQIPELSAHAEKTEPIELSEMARELLEEAESARRGGRKDYELIPLLTMHGRELVREVRRMEEVWLLKTVALGDLEIGAYGAAVEELTRLWLLLEVLLGRQDPKTIAATIDLAKAMDKAGSRYARDFARDALSMAATALCDDSEITIEARATLATTLKTAGELDEALQLDERILDQKRRLLGPDDPSTVIATDNLGYTLHALALQRKDRDLLDRAIKLHEESWNAFTRIFGPEKPQTLTAKNNLAGALVDRGEVLKAGELFEQVYETRKRVQGEKHPYTIRALISRARNAHHLGDERAFGWLTQAVGLAREVLGSSHPDTLIAILVQANWLRSRNELVGARRSGEEVLQACRQRFGEGHERTIEAMSELIETLRAQGDRTAEQVRLEELVAARRSAQGAVHPETVSSMRALAASYYDTGNYEGSARIEKSIHEVLVQSLGEADPVTVVALWDLASSHLALGKLEEAEQMMERVSELRKQTLGRDHPHTIEARYNLFAILLKAGKLDVAEARIEEVRKDLARLKQRALEQVELGKDREARSQLEELVNLCRRIMGDTEDTTLEATGYLVGLLLRTGEYRDALPCLQSLVETSKKLHGEDHPNTKAVTSLYVQTLARVFADTGAR